MTSFADVVGGANAEVLGRCDVGGARRLGRGLLDLGAVQRLLGCGARERGSVGHPRADGRVLDEVELVRRRRSSGVGVHTELQRIRGWVPGRPGRQPGHGLRRVDRARAPRATRSISNGQRGRLALLRVRDQHRSVRGNRDHPVRGRPRRFLLEVASRALARGTSRTRRCSGCRGTRARCSAGGRCRIWRCITRRSARARSANTTSSERVGRKRCSPRRRLVATAGVPVRLDASGSSSPAGSITDYAWDFDGSKSYSTDGGGTATISHTFSSPGTYTIDLRVKDSLGETATVSHTITVGGELGHYEQAVEETPGVTHFWPMGESSGSSFADVVGGANAEALGGVTLGEPGGLVGRLLHGGRVQRLLGRCPQRSGSVGHPPADG